MQRDAAKASAQFVCRTCDRAFTRREHLQRHALMHGSDRPFTCEFCSQTFGRRDVLKRHFQVCKARADAGLEMPVLPQNTRGKKRTACVRCGSRKIACSSTVPCIACERSNNRCEYSSSKSKGSSTARQEQPSIEATSREHLDHIGSRDGPGLHKSQDLAEISFANLEKDDDEGFEIDAAFVFDSQLTPNTKYGTSPESMLSSYIPGFDITGSGLAFNFLKRSTQSLGLAGSFEVGTLEERKFILNRVASSGMASFNQQPTAWTEHAGVNHSWSCHAPFSNTPFHHEPRLILPSDLSNDSVVGLQGVTDAIVAMIKEATIYKSTSSNITMAWSQSTEARCYAFFSPQSLAQNLDFYWSCWYPNFPAIHRPSFTPTSSSTTLVAAMALIGACLSPRSTDRASANLWFNGLEELAFQDPLLLDDSICVKDGALKDRAAIRRRLEAIQAAYLIVLFQNWEGSKLSQRRVRHQAYATLVAASRGFGLCNISRRHLGVRDFSEFCWLDFVLLEALIRLSAYIFLLEFAFVIFHNMPPRLTVTEMKLSLAAPEECFQAQSAEECFVLLSSWTHDHPEQSRISVYESVEILCNSEYSGDTDLQSFVGLSALNLFTIVSALHCVAFHLNQSIPTPSQFTHIKKALGAWMYLWNQQIYVGPSEHRVEDMWKRVGFMRHAAEYWLLTQTIVDRIIPFNCRLFDETLWDRRVIPQPELVYDDHEMDSLKAIIEKFQAMTYLST